MDLASYRRCATRIREAWPGFSELRAKRLAQQERHGQAAEKVAENIVEDLFTQVLDWNVSDLNNQIGYADLVLTNLGIKQIVVEVKRPHALVRRQRALEAALDQVRGYADDQRVRCVAVTDAVLFYAADIQAGGLRGRALLSLDAKVPAVDELWWMSVDGVWRERSDATPLALAFEPEPVEPVGPPDAANAALVHPKYHLPCHCFAFVGDASDTSTWKLPYLHADGRVDEKRLPGAIRAILANYRGTKVMLPEVAVPETLARLGRAAATLGRLGPGRKAPKTYQQLTAVLDQLGLLDELIASDG